MEEDQPWRINVVIEKKRRHAFYRNLVRYPLFATPSELYGQVWVDQHFPHFNLGWSQAYEPCDLLCCCRTEFLWRMAAITFSFWKIELFETRWDEVREWYPFLTIENSHISVRVTFRQSVCKNCESLVRDAFDLLFRTCKTTGIRWEQNIVLSYIPSGRMIEKNYAAYLASIAKILILQKFGHKVVIDVHAEPRVYPFLEAVVPFFGSGHFGIFQIDTEVYKYVVTREKYSLADSRAFVMRMTGYMSRRLQRPDYPSPHEFAVEWNPIVTNPLHPSSRARNLLVNPNV